MDFLSGTRFQYDIIRFCAEAPGSAVIGGAPYGNKVVKLNDGLVVKFGVGVTADEARNQSKAYEILDRNILRVPKVHSFFQDSYDRGYIIMELLSGEIKEPLIDEVCLHAVSGIVKYLTTFHADRPGPLGGGRSCALVFGESDEPTFTTIQDMEEWLNRRLLQPNENISLEGFSCVLCHLDLFPRNIIWKEGEAPGVLDWSSAGFYPRLFQKCSYLVVGDDVEDFTRELFARLPEISENESTQINLILRVWRNIQKFNFATPKKIEDYSELFELVDCDKQPPPPLPPYPEAWLEELEAQ